MLCRGEFKSEIRTKNKYWHTLRVFGIFKFTFTYSDFNGKVFHNIYIHKCDNSVFNIIIFFQYFELISKKIPIRLFLESSGWVDQSYRLWLRWQNNPWRIQTWCRRNCSYRRFLKSYVRAVGTGGPGGPGGSCSPPIFWLSQKQTPFSFKRSSIFLGPPIPPTDFWTFRRPWCLYAWCIMYCKCNVHNFMEKRGVNVMTCSL